MRNLLNFFLFFKQKKDLPPMNCYLQPIVYKVNVGDSLCCPLFTVGLRLK